MKIILASSSKNRQDIFNMLGLKYEIITSTLEEKSNQTNPQKYVLELSQDKAKSVEQQINDKAIIIAVDEVIYMNDKIYEKPKTKEEAYNNIKEMQGKTITAITGITIKDLYQNKQIGFTDECKLTIKNNITEKDIKWYVDNEPTILNRCGLAILGKASIFIDKVEGDYNTLFGISPSKMHDKLKELGYEMQDFDLN